ncbi:Xaa-Pro peptidase family protein [Microbacterium soli]|uniref:Aminopeptidase P family protein n=1 Tax=Microbacterium soli TaxID=446075 RepID=A0ABP7NBB1_9MICO
MPISDERTARVAGMVAEQNAHAALLTGYDSIAYAAGLRVSQELGAPFVAGGPDALVVSPAGEMWLLVPRMRGSSARESRADHVIEYGTDSLIDVPLWQHYREGLGRLLDAAGLRAGTLLVEPDTLSATAAELIALRDLERLDATAALQQVRKTKTAVELEVIRRGAALTSTAQRRAAEAVRPGRTELECFAEVRAVWDDAIGGRCEVTGDFISGIDRTAGVVGWASDRVIREGDPVIVDLAPRMDLYWGDSANTLFVGEPGAEFLRMHRAVSSALQAGVDATRPGLSVGELDRIVRSTVERAGYTYPHHTGHSVGTASHEFPSIVPGAGEPLEPDMVILLEPGAYVPGIGGVRLEWMLAVTGTGAEVLSAFPLDPTLGLHHGAHDVGQAVLQPRGRRPPSASVEAGAVRVGRDISPE